METDSVSINAPREKILLEGQGPDELLGGYPNRCASAYFRSEIDHARWDTLPGMFHRVLASATSYENRRILQRKIIGKLRRSRPQQRSLLSRRLEALPPYDPGFPPASPPSFNDRLTNRLWQDHASVILPYLLHFGDAISMGHSMESRLPFLDHRLVEFVFALPFHGKIRGRESKAILRQSLKNEIPSEILARRRKVGFDTPADTWLKQIFRSELIPLFNSSRLRQRDLFDTKALASLLTAFETRGSRPDLILRCAAIELWFRQFIDGDGFRA